MANMEFFATSAQVLPTLSIGIILERWALTASHGASLAREARGHVVIRSPALSFIFAFFAVGECSAMLGILLWPLSGGWTRVLTWCTGIPLAALTLSLLPLGVTRVRETGPRRSK